MACRESLPGPSTMALTSCGESRLEEMTQRENPHSLFLERCLHRYGSSGLYVVNKKTGAVLDVQASGLSDNTPIISYPCYKTSNQQWEFVDVTKALFEEALNKSPTTTGTAVGFESKWGNESKDGGDLRDGFLKVCQTWNACELSADAFLSHK